MQLGLKIWLEELIWILAILVISLLIDFLIFKQLSIFSDTIDIQMHDTYFVISGVRWVSHIFVVLAIITYMLKEMRRGYNDALANIILAMLLTGLLFILLPWHQIQSMDGWTVYPSLSALPALAEPPNEFLEFGDVAFIGVELLIIIAIFLLGFKTGKLLNRIR